MHPRGIVAHYSLLKGWDKSRWPNFTAKELSCPHCGEYYHWPEFLDRLQNLRDLLGRPISINSAHRCIFWNAWVGGVAKSQHKTLAVDISLRGHDPKSLFAAAVKGMFKGFGFYNTFLHLDLGRPRAWPIRKKRNKQWL